MIELTKLNGKAFILNALHIEQIEEAPDTIITLTNARKYLVQESPQEVAKRVKRFFQDTSLRLIVGYQKGDEEDEG